MELAEELLDIVDDLCGKLEQSNESVEDLVGYARDLSLAIYMRLSQLESGTTSGALDN